MGHDLRLPTNIDLFTHPSNNVDGKAHYKPTKEQMLWQANLMAEELKRYEIKGGKIEQPTLEQLLSPLSRPKEPKPSTPQKTPFARFVNWLKLWN
jgi:hypothetical protein